jgi:hypothetical protein
VESLRRIADAWLRLPVVVSCYAFSKLVSLNCASTKAEIVARKFPFDFIEVVAKKDSRGNNTSPGRRLHDNIYSSKKHVEEVCPHVWGVTLFREAELSAVAAINHRLITCLDPV